MNIILFAGCNSSLSLNQAVDQLPVDLTLNPDFAHSYIVPTSIIDGVKSTSKPVDFQVMFLNSDDSVISGYTPSSINVVWSGNTGNTACLCVQSDSNGVSDCTCPCPGGGGNSTGDLTIALSLDLNLTEQIHCTNN